MVEMDSLSSAKDPLGVILMMFAQTHLHLAFPSLVHLTSNLTVYGALYIGLILCSCCYPKILSSDTSAFL